MRTTHRRIVRRAVIALAGVVLLLGWYIGAWVCWPRIWAISYYRFPSGTLATIDRCFVPILWYTRTSYPGSRELSSLWWTVNADMYWTAERSEPLEVHVEYKYVDE